MPEARIYGEVGAVLCREIRLDVDKMSAIKILYIIENSSFGGGERSFAGLINGAGGDLDRYAACGIAEPFYGQIKEAARVFPVDLSNRYNIFNVFVLASIIKKYNIDIAHSQGARVDFYTALASRLAGARHFSTVAVLVEGFDVGPLRKAVYRFFSRLGESMTDRFIVVSETLKKAMIEKHGIAAEKIAVIPNGVNAGIFENAAPDKNLVLKYGLSGKRVIGCAARLVWPKGLEYLIQAMAVLRDRDKTIFERTVCVIAGQGERDSSLNDLIQKAGLEGKVILSGFASDVPAFLKTLDIFVLPSLREGQPIALLEAMAQGKPIIASDIEGVTETVRDGFDALLVPPGDPVALSSAIKRLADDAEFAGKLGANARRTVREKFTPEKFIRAHAGLYRDFIGRKDV